MRKIRNAIFKYRNQDNCYNMLKIQCAEQIDRLDKTDRQTTRTTSSCNHQWTKRNTKSYLRIDDRLIVIMYDYE